MVKLPTEREQHWLIVELATLIKARGWESFIVNPIVEPTRHYFPDPWEFSRHGVDRLTRRLLQYAGLGHLEVAVVPFEEASNHEGLCTAGLFLGIEEGTCVFGFNVESPDEDEYAAGVMAHEVTHAYRRHYGLINDDLQTEELLTDLTASYLGFGVLCTNNSYRYRTAGGYGVQQWSTNEVGYLPLQAFAYLLGLQLVARDNGTQSTRRLLRHLEPNQASLTKEAVRHWQERSADIPQLFAFPPLGARPTARAVAEILQPLPPYQANEELDAHVREPLGNEGRPVFRLHSRRTLERTVQTMIVGTLLAFGQYWLTNSLELAVAFVAVSACLGAWWGRHSTELYCSAPGCVRVLRPDDEVCPRCGGTVSGDIQRAIDHFDAAETVTRKQVPEE